ncbi:hypothetical protein [Novosphingobium sp. AP12]|uniref:hypothetical protein n=1 Tax=Novosphingobium sp. AP12 TaxID=1144305 RepID=UPI0002720B0B|nr:hypothetical protein [Novosphingobium sp. AP12]EJL23985.1 hypothetical protein PMI02_03906 [Novosphingobium sp. AP12]
MADHDNFTSDPRHWLKAASLPAPKALPTSAGLAAEHPERSPRVRTLICAVIGGAGRAGEDGIVRNASPGSMCIASRTLMPERGETLRVALPGQGDLQAEVR